MTAFYICAILLAPMLFMGMIPSAHAQDTEKTDTGITGPGKSTHSVQLSPDTAASLEAPSSTGSASWPSGPEIICGGPYAYGLTDLAPVIGIDLGTTYSCVGIMKGGKVEILVNDQGNRITPSWVAWNDDERLVGDAAKNQFAANPHRTVYDIKRLIGRKFDDKDVQKDLKHFPYKVINKGGQPRVKVDVKG